MTPPRWLAGIARRVINPPPGVELAGLGYYLGRTWERIHDNLNATALVVTEARSSKSIACVALDLMYNDAAFTARVRSLAKAKTGFAAESICVNFSHTHNAPTAGFIRGAGERSPAYLEFAAQQSAAAIVEALERQIPTRLYVGQAELSGMTFNRATANGPTDNKLSVLRVDAENGRPLAVAINFHSHCTAHMEVDLLAVARDWPGEVVDQVESALPGVTALYLQGTCGDVNFRREFNGTERRFEPAPAVTRTALQAFANARPIESSGIASFSNSALLPTRPWTPGEINAEREEARYRLETADIAGRQQGFARVCVNQPERLPSRYGGSEEAAVKALCRFALEWTDDILPTLATRPRHETAEVQAIRLGDVWFAAHPAELFTSLGLVLRQRSKSPDLFVLGYSNGSIGYLPDAAEVQRGGYAALQSPKFTGQFPFTEAAGTALVEAMLKSLEITHMERGHSCPPM